MKESGRIVVAESGYGCEGCHFEAFEMCIGNCKILVCGRRRIGH